MKFIGTIENNYIKTIQKKIVKNALQGFQQTTYEILTL